MRQCPICGEKTATRYARYCSDHKGGSAATPYGVCKGTARMIKDAMLSDDEGEHFSELARSYGVREMTLGQKTAYFHLFLLDINILRESNKLKTKASDIATIHKLISLHTGLSEKLGILKSKGQSSPTDVHGINEFLSGTDDSNATPK